MPRTKRRPADKAGRQYNQGAVENSAADYTVSAEGTPTAGDRFHYVCPLCGKAKGTADYKVSRGTGAERWFLNCWTARCQDDYLARLAAEVGTTAYELIEDPRRWLAEHIEHRGRRREEAARLPVVGDVAEWHVRLRRTPRAINYLRESRGLTTHTIRRYALGYVLPGDWPGPRWQSELSGFALPIFAGGELIGVRKRFWPKVPPDRDGKPIKYTGPEGHAARLYPRLPRSRAVLLCEGELDALLLRQKGLAAVSTTCGASLPEHLAGAFKGRRVAVVYDTGALALAARTVDRLLAAGAREAWAVDLALSQEGDDLTDWFVTYKRHAGALRALINRARRSA